MSFEDKLQGAEQAAEGDAKQAATDAEHGNKDQAETDLKDAGQAAKDSLG